MHCFSRALHVPALAHFRHALHCAEPNLPCWPVSHASMPVLELADALDADDVPDPLADALPPPAPLLAPVPLFTAQAAAPAKSAPILHHSFTRPLCYSRLPARPRIG